MKAEILRRWHSGESVNLLHHAMDISVARIRRIIRLSGEEQGGKLNLHYLERERLGPLIYADYLAGETDIAVLSFKYQIRVMDCMEWLATDFGCKINRKHHIKPIRSMKEVGTQLPKKKPKIG